MTDYRLRSNSLSMSISKYAIMYAIMFIIILSHAHANLKSL